MEDNNKDISKLPHYQNIYKSLSTKSAEHESPEVNTKEEFTPTLDQSSKLDTKYNDNKSGKVPTQVLSSTDEYLQYKIKFCKDNKPFWEIKVPEKVKGGSVEYWDSAYLELSKLHPLLNESEDIENIRRQMI